MLLYIPLAWLQLIHQRVRFIATLGGIAFVVVLLFIQLGFQDALFESSVRVHNSLQGDLFLISSQYKAMTSQQSFPRTRLYQVLAVDGVESVSFLYVQFGKLKNINDGQKYPIFILGIDPGKLTFNSSDVNQNLDKIKVLDMALFDQDSRPEFGPIAERFNQGKTVKLEIAEFNEITIANKLEISGLFSIGPSFGVDGNLITNYSTLLHMFKSRRADDIDVGLISLQPGANRQKVREDLVAILPKDVKVITLQEFIAIEKAYWNLRTPIGFVFKIMVSMGFLVGIGVTYQILYSNISNHWVAYATLKAIGHSDRSLLNAVFQQAFLLAFLGYIPGIIISFGVYDLARNGTHLPVIMTVNKVFTVLISVLIMCLISGALAMQKLRSVDPAEIF